MVRQRGGGLNVPMRWGKSWVGIHWAASLYYLEGVQRVVVMTVTSGLGVWEGQVAQHCPVPWRVVDHEGQLLSQSRASGDTGRLTFLLVNYPNVWARAYPYDDAPREWVVVTNQTLKKFDAQAIIADESHHLGNPSAETSKHAFALARPIRFRLFMTGTMFHRKPFYVFGQMKFYDDGATFGTAFTHFKKRIAVFRDPQGYVVLRYRNLKWMMDQVKPVVYIERKIPHRKLVRNSLLFNLTGKNLKLYETMEKDRVVTVQGETLSAEVILTQHLWLMMMAGGFLRLPSGKYVQIGNDKLAMCKDRLAEYLEQDITKAVIACRFRPELVGIAKVARAVGFKVITFHGGVPKGRERFRRTEAFQRTKQPTVFISQISAGKESIELSAAEVILWYSMTESYVEFDQFGDRTRVYGDKRTHMHDFLLARGTRDEVTLDSMKLKMDVAEYLVSNPEHVEKITARRR